MIDFTTTSCSLGMYLYCFVFYMAIALLYWNRCCSSPIGQPLTVPQRSHLHILPILILIWIITEFSEGDFWHYQAVVRGDYEQQLSENIYVMLADLVGHNYLFFRIFVWGSALLLVSATLRRLELDLYRGLYFLFVMYTFTFGYARASLAMSCFYFGLSIVAFHANSHSSIKTTWGYLLIFASFFLHHSIFVLILFSAFIRIPITRKMLLIMTLSVPVLGMMVHYILTSTFSVANLEILSTMADKAAIYTDFESEEISFLEHVREFWLFSLFYIPFIYATYKLVLSKNRPNVPDYILIMYRISFYIVMLTLAILFINLPNNIFFYRYLYTLMIPNTIIFTYFYQHNLVSSRFYRFLMLYAIGFIMFRCGKKILGWSGPIS